MARPWSARCYGVARPREGSRLNSIGLGRAFTPAFRAGLLQSPACVGCRRICRRRNLEMVFGRAATGSWGRPDLDLIIRVTRVIPLFITL